MKNSDTTRVRRILIREEFKLHIKGFEYVCGRGDVDGPELGYSRKGAASCTG